MRRARSLREAMLRVQALIAVLEEDLRAPCPAISLPERLSHLTGKVGVEARLALRFLAHSVEGMELYLSTLPRHRTAALERDVELYEQEIAAARQLLKQCTDAEFDWTTP